MIPEYVDLSIKHHVNGQMTLIKMTSMRRIKRLVYKVLKEIRKHYSNVFNFRSYDHLVLKLYQFQELFDIKVSIM